MSTLLELLDAWLSAGLRGSKAAPPAGPAPGRVPAPAAPPLLARGLIMRRLLS